MPKHNTILIAVFCAGSALVSCAEKDINNSQPDRLVRVSGEVLAWYCDIRDQWNPTPEPRYTVATGLSAQITFTSMGVLAAEIESNGFSTFEARIIPGVYDLVVEIPHARPDTFPGVQIMHDTTIELNLIYDHVYHDTIIFWYYYRDVADSLGQETELEQLFRFREALHDVADFSEVRRHNGLFPGRRSGSVLYLVPLRPGRYFQETYETAVLFKDSLTGLPASLFIMSGGWICLR